MSRSKPKINCRWIAEKSSYEYRFRYGGKRYSCYGKTESEAIEKGREKERLLSERMNLDNRKIILETYYSVIWLEEQRKVVKESTVYAYEKQWKNIRDALGHKKVIDITKGDILQFQSMLAKKKSRTTVNSCIRLLKQILAAAVEDRILSYNPCTVKPLRVEKERATNTIHRALSVAETETFMKYAAESHYYNLFRFLLNTGLRIGEATGLQWFDIHDDEISITKTVSRTSGSGYSISSTPKTASSCRTIQATDNVKAILQDQKQRNIYLFGMQPWVFPNSRGKMANYNSIDVCIHSIVKVINNAGIEFQPFTVHAFRDTFATRCIEQGMNPHTLMKIMGHSSLKMTMELYAQVMPETMKKEMEKIKIV